jgi:hypothetical protein
MVSPPQENRCNRSLAHHQLRQAAIEVSRLRELAFHTGLIAIDYYRFPDTPYKGKGWHFDLVSPASKLPVGSVVVNGTAYPAKEAVIWADNEIVAQRAANLTHSARLLIAGANLLSLRYPGEHAPIHRANPKFASTLTEDESRFLSNNRVMTHDIPLACRIAARASLRVQYIYALAKFRLSLETFSAPMIELDPCHSANSFSSLAIVVSRPRAITCGWVRCSTSSEAPLRSSAPCAGVVLCSWTLHRRR